MEMKEDKSKVETYHVRVSPLYIVFPTAVGVCILFSVAQWITNPQVVWAFPSILFLTIIFLVLLLNYRQIGKITISLTPNAFVEKGFVKMTIQWGDIDHIVFSPDRFLRKLCIYYKKDNRIKRFIPSYSSIERKGQFIESLQKLSDTHEFAFERG